jgi:hypothetical protein
MSQLPRARSRNVGRLSSCPESILSTLAVIRAFFRSRSDTTLEVRDLRQQVAVLN